MPYSWREIPLTIESIDGILPHGARDPSINPLILVALVLQEILKYVQHLGHLHKVKKWQFNSMFPLAYWLQVSVLSQYIPIEIIYLWRDEVIATPVQVHLYLVFTWEKMSSLWPFSFNFFIMLDRSSSLPHALVMAVPSYIPFGSLGASCNQINHRVYFQFLTLY